MSIGNRLIFLLVLNIDRERILEHLFIRMIKGSLLIRLSIWSMDLALMLRKEVSMRSGSLAMAILIKLYP